jgi:hypothetical protein
MNLFEGRTLHKGKHASLGCTPMVKANSYTNSIHFKIAKADDYQEKGRIMKSITCGSGPNTHPGTIIIMKL